MKNKITFSILCILFCAGGLFSQPVGTPNVTVPSGVPFSSFSWFRGGNIAGGAAGTNNIFGTAAGFNSGIYTMTNGINRTRLNGTLTTTIGGVLQNVDGYFGIGPNGFFATNSPASMLHLQGPDNSGFGGGGWRSWMKTGMFVNENSDAMYIGLKNQGPGVNRSDAIINWSDDAAAGGGGADKLRFVFTAAASNPTSLNGLIPASLPGYEYMRMVASGSQFNSFGAAVGNIGIGPVFTDILPPTNRLHLNAEENLSNFMQITNQNGTNQTINDGLHVGYAPTSLVNKEAVINQKENDRLALYANNGERIRIMQIGALNNGVAFNPGTLATNLTRIGVSHDPTQPVTRPLSLMHLGYNTGATNDGWRNWMDVGTFTANGTDNMYVGLKREPTAFPIDRFDAVINWGDNSGPAGPFAIGPDNLRFIFTSATVGTPGLPPSNGVNGVEGMRMTPSINIAGTNAHVWTGIGGDPTVNLYGPLGASINPTQTLEVNSSEATSVVGGSSGLRFTNLNTTSPTTLTNPGLGVLAVDADGDVIYVPATAGTGVGNYCVPTPGANPLVGDYEIPLAAFNYRFTGQSVPFDPTALVPNQNVVGIGYACGAPMPAKFSVLQSFGGTTIGTNAGAFINEDFTSGTAAITYRGVVGVARGIQPGGNKSPNIGGEFNAVNAVENYGVRATAGNSTVPSTNFAGFFSATANTPSSNYGIYTQAGNATGNNYGVYSACGPAGTPGAGTPSGPNYAGFFNGDVYISGTYGPSDINLKDSIVDITNVMDIINQLNPKTFEFKHSAYPSMNLPHGLQYGLIAQEVETVLPALITNNVQPEVLDSLGAVVTPAVTFKGLEYQQLIPILIEGLKEQQSTIDSLKDENDVQDSINTSLQNQINQLATLINSCCNSHSMQSNNSNQSITSQDVNLKDGQAIVLEQNVPNPFAEQTTINYFLPDNVVKAQILFYNVSGKLIQSVDLNEKGKGSLNVFASDLSNGIYTYTLVVDGQIIETKKMVKQQ